MKKVVAVAATVDAGLAESVEINREGHAQVRETVNPAASHGFSGSAGLFFEFGIIDYPVRKSRLWAGTI
ncbi:MAG: hypothetical protein GY815_00830 [Gammaproteobacteria bacterium]|nr:hypothetical protein [Gammaproteobacteria bacterium]